VQDVRVQLTTFFPQTGTFTSSAPGVGAVTFDSSQATGFISVTTSSGAVVYLATYPSS
jgi:hypothetical protein